MANPLPQDLRYVDPALTNIAIGWMNSMPTIWRQLFPIVDVSYSKGFYAKYDKPQWMRISAQVRAPGAPPKRADFKVSKDSYECVEYELSADIFDEDIDEQMPPFDVRSDKTRFTAMHVEHRIEKEAAQTVFKSGFWKKDLATPPGGKWTTGNTPAADILDLRRQFVLENSLPINCIVMGSLVYQRLKNNTDIVGSIGANRDQIVDLNLLMRLFGLDQVPGARILIPELVENTDPEAENDTHTGAFVWKEDAMWLGYCNTSAPSKEDPNALLCLQRYPAVTRAWRDDERRVETVQTYSKLGFVVPSTDLGIYIDDVVD